MSVPTVPWRALLILTSSGLLCVCLQAAQAQQLEYSSAHRNGERSLPQTLSGGSPEFRSLVSAERSAVSLAVADFDGDGIPDLVTGFATGTGGAITLQRGSSAATAPTSSDWAAIQRGELVPAFAATANITPLPVRPDLLKAVDINGDGAIDVVVAAHGDNSFYVLLGDGRGGLLPAKAVSAGGTITALSTVLRADGSSMLAAGVCRSANNCAVQLFATDGLLLSSLSLPASASAVEAVSLNGHSGATDLAVIAGGHVLIADGNALIAGKASFETLAVSNAVALASGYFIFDRRPYTQLAVLDSLGRLHVLVRPGLDSHAVTLAESLAERKLTPNQMPASISPIGFGWTEAETLNVGAGGFIAPPLMVRARVSGSGGDDLLVLSGTKYIIVRHAMDTVGTEMKTTPSVVVDSTTNNIAAAVPLRMSPDVRQGIVVVDGSDHPNITLPTVNQIFTVNTTTDASDTTVAGRCTPANSGAQCTLRDAILLANADSSTNRTNSKIDTVNVPTGTYNLTYNSGADAGGNATYHIEITGPVNIVGAGAATTIIDGQAKDKIFSINSGVVVSQNPFDTFITSVTLQNAKDNNSAGNDPYGGILDWDADGGGYLTIATSTLQTSTAFVGPGGAIAAFNAAGSGAGTLELDSSTVTGNNTPEMGGGLYVTTQVPLVLNATTVSSNHALISVNSSDAGKLGEGGGIFTDDNTLSTVTSITNGSVITGNTSTDSGGGIYTASGMAITSSSITGNTSSSYGGGIYVSVLSTEAVTGNYLTLTGNTASTDGGAIYATSTSGTPLAMHYSRIHGNTNASHAGVSIASGTTANVTDNWWGCNGAGTGTGCDASGGAGTFTATPYTTLKLTMSSSTPSGSASFSATGSMAQDSSNTAYTGNQDNALASVPATLTITQPDTTVTNSGSTTLSATDTIVTTVTPDTGQVDYGAGSAAVTVDGTTVSTTFTLEESDMKVTSSHSGNFVAGSTGNTYTLTVSNIGNSPSSGAVTVVDTLPSGFTATGLTGTSWSCTLGTLTCTRSDALGGSSSYTAITLTVTAATTAGSVNNTATVSGGGELYTGNDTGTDSTSVTAAAMAKFVITGLGPFTAPGSAGTATVVATDTYNNTVTTYNGTVHFTSTDADATLPANYTFVSGDNGVHTFNGTTTFNTAGTFSFTATDTVSGNTGSETGIVVNDAIWLLNGNIQLEHISDSGSTLNQTTVTGTASTLGAVAFDNTGNVWAVSNANSDVYEFSHIGTTVSGGTTGGGINTPTAIAIDGLGNAWIANGNNTITEFTNSRTAVTPSTGYQSGSTKLSTPTGLIIDNAGSIWIANSGNNTVTKVIGGAAPVVTPTVTGTTNNTLGTRP